MALGVLPYGEQREEWGAHIKAKQTGEFTMDANVVQAAMAKSAKLMTDDKGRVAMFSAWAAEIQSQQWHHSLLLRVSLLPTSL